MGQTRRDSNDAGVTGGSPNRDPITGEPGAHPVGAGVGAAAAGAAAGAAGGAVAGPIGAAVGAVVGGVAGGLAGKGIAESMDPTVEDAYWRETYASRPYYDNATAYDDYQPAYRYGWESRQSHAGRTWDEAETDLERGWDRAKAHSRLAWDRAKHATRDAWDRVESRFGSGSQTADYPGIAAGGGATHGGAAGSGTSATGSGGLASQPGTRRDDPSVGHSGSDLR